MGKKNRDEQRRQAMAASSAKASSRFADAGGAAGGFVGFETLSGDVLETALRPELRVLFSKLRKKDATTKVKALQDIAELCAGEATDDDIASMTECYPRMYLRLGMDADRRVRENSHIALQHLAVRAKKLLAPHLKTIIGTWMLGRFDPARNAASAASAAFAAVFPPDKEAKTLAFCQTELFDFFSDNLLRQTATSLSEGPGNSSDANDIAAKYERVVSASLLALAALMHKLPEEPLAALAGRFDELLAASKLWKHAKHSSPMVRAALLDLAGVAAVRQGALVEAHGKRVVQTACAALADADSSVIRSAWSALLALCKHTPAAWEAVDVRKVLWPALWPLLRDGCRGMAETTFKSLPVFLAHLPPSKLAPAAGLVAPLFTSTWAGTAALRYDARAKEALVSALFSSATFFISQYPNNEDVSEEDASETREAVVQAVVREILQPAGELVPAMPTRVMHTLVEEFFRLADTASTASPSCAHRLWELTTEWAASCLQPRATSPAAAPATSASAETVAEPAAEPAAETEAPSAESTPATAALEQPPPPAQSTEGSVRFEEVAIEVQHPDATPADEPSASGNASRAFVVAFLYQLYVCAKDKTTASAATGAGRLAAAAAATALATARRTSDADLLAIAGSLIAQFVNIPGLFGDDSPLGPAPSALIAAQLQPWLADLLSGRGGEEEDKVERENTADVEELASALVGALVALLTVADLADAKSSAISAMVGVLQPHPRLLSEFLVKGHESWPVLLGDWFHDNASTTVSIFTAALALPSSSAAFCAETLSVILSSDNALAALTADHIQATISRLSDVFTSYLDSPPDHLQQCRAALAVTETLYTQAFGAYAAADVLIKQRRPLLDATAVAIFKVAHMVQKACVAAAAEKSDPSQQARALLASMLSLIADAEPEASAALSSSLVALVCDAHEASRAAARLPGAEWEQQSKQAARWAAALFSAETPLFDRVEQLEGILPLAQISGLWTEMAGVQGAQNLQILRMSGLLPCNLDPDVEAAAQTVSAAASSSSSSTLQSPPPEWLASLFFAASTVSWMTPAGLLDCCAAGGRPEVAGRVLAILVQADVCVEFFALHFPATAGEDAHLVNLHEQTLRHLLHGDHGFFAAMDKTAPAHCTAMEVAAMALLNCAVAAPSVPMLTALSHLLSEGCQRGTLDKDAASRIVEAAQALPESAVRQRILHTLVNDILPAHHHLPCLGAVLDSQLQALQELDTPAPTDFEQLAMASHILDTGFSDTYRPPAKAAADHRGPSDAATARNAAGARALARAEALRDMARDDGWWEPMQKLLAIMLEWQNEDENIFVIDPEEHGHPAPSAWQPHIAANIEACKFFATCVDRAALRMSAEDWDFVLCTMVEWLDVDTSSFNGKVLLSHSCRLAASLSLFFQRLEQAKEAGAAVPETVQGVLQEWYDFFQPSLSRRSIPLLLKARAALAADSSNSATIMMFDNVALAAETCSDDVLTELCPFADLCGLLALPHEGVQRATFSLLVRLIELTGGDFVVRHDGEGEGGGDDEAKQSESGAAAVGDAASVFEHPLLKTIAEIRAQALDDEDAPDDGNTELSLQEMLAWLAFLDCFQLAAMSERISWGWELRKTRTVAGIVSRLAGDIVDDPPSKADVEGIVASGRDVAHWTPVRLGLRLFVRVLTVLPAFVRNWFENSCPKRWTQPLLQLVGETITPIIVGVEMAAVQADKSKHDNLLVRARPATGEVRAAYTLDSMTMEMVVTLPEAYPLRPVEVQCGQKIGVPPAMWRNWLLQMTSFMAHQNGRILDAVLIWKRNADRHFEGVEDCTICYAVLSGTNFQLPSQRCKTCKNMFHSSCLFKWFSTSGQSTCPLCRNLF